MKFGDGKLKMKCQNTLESSTGEGTKIGSKFHQFYDEVGDNRESID